MWLYYCFFNVGNILTKIQLLRLCSFHDSPVKNNTSGLWSIRRPQGAALILNCGFSQLWNTRFPVWLLDRTQSLLVAPRSRACSCVLSLTGRQHWGKATENWLLRPSVPNPGVSPGKTKCFLVNCEEPGTAVSFISKFTLIPPLTVASKKNRDAPYGKAQWIGTTTYAYKRKHQQIFLKLAWIDTLWVSKSCLCLWDGRCWQKG